MDQKFCSSILLSLLLSATSVSGFGNQFYIGPADKSRETFDQWWGTYQDWRDQIRDSLDLSAYDNPAVQWAATSFIQTQLMIHDRFLYDRQSRQWTVGKYLSDVRSRYGGLDSVLLWQGYPNIGVDDRNQFEMTESLPGGLEGLREVARQFHQEGVRVLLPYIPWDQFTDNAGKADYETLVDQLVAAELDGFNGDTMDGVNRTFWEEGLSRGYPIVIEPEVLGSSFSYLSYNLMSWGYWTPGAKAPRV